MLFRSDRKSTRLNSSHTIISYAVFCLKKKQTHAQDMRESPHATLPPPQPDARAASALRFRSSPARLEFTVVSTSAWALFFFLMIRRPPRSTPLSLHDALPIWFNVDAADRTVTMRIATSLLSVDQAQKDRKSTRLNSSHTIISYAVFCLKK